MIGATGGSGTRVVARIVRAAGMYIGNDLNRYEDALPFAAFSDRWINEYLASGASPAPDSRTQMRDELQGLVDEHLSHRPEDAITWGWKEPRSIYLLPFLNEEIPGLRFLHFVRDGRDMAFSENQQQLKKHGAAVLGGELRWRRRPYRSVALWARVNGTAADYGERELGSRYLRVRFEDLCTRPGVTARQILDFFGLDGDAEAIAAAEVRPPSTLARWRTKGARTVGNLERLGEPALSRFSYR
ncbi:MAG: sulfotransferase [Gaiellaceae bacterium]